MKDTVVATDFDAESRQQRLQQARGKVNSILLGKERQVALAFCSLLARGHLLIEDVPGVGKTTLANAMARVIGAEYQRVQFTSDLLPADILGVSIYKREKDAFEFHPGPIFSQVILADEVNRATPKTQSALLEGMAEGQVSIENETHALPRPFFVMATQNPVDLVGTFPLPESQLDRFMLSFSLGYPDEKAERELLTLEDRSRVLVRTEPVLSPEDVIGLQADAERIHVSEGLIDYVQALLKETRDERWFETGLSPRAGLALLRASRALALLESRDHVLPEDVKTIFPSLARHRLSPNSGFSQSPEDQIRELLQQVPIP
jgi:MoxR-like ATPase